MKLALSSDTLPDSPLEELTHAAERRALASLELRVGTGHGHGLDEDLCVLRQQAGVQCTPVDAARISWLLVPKDISLISLMMWAGAAEKLGAGIIIQSPVADAPSGLKLALLHGSDPEEVEAAVNWAQRHGASTCWQADQSTLDEATVIRVLDRTGSTLAHIRLVGSGPDAINGGETGPGVLTLYTRLALTGFSGTIAMVPSKGSDLDVWRRWLLQKKGWGCGTAHEKANGKH